MTHSMLHSARPQRPMLAQTNTELSPEQPKYEDVIQMLNAAHKDAKISYAHRPQLRDELQQQFRDSIHTCQTHERPALDILMARLRGERMVFDAYNKHRLGQATFRYYKAVPAPDDAEARLKSLGEDIEEDLENFPLRFQVVDGGFHALTENLRPIYQVADHAARLATKAQTTAQVPPATRVKSSAKPPQPSTPKADKGYDKLRDSPVPNLDFPKGNITLAELAAFNPQAFKSWDMIDRFCGNGGSQATLAVMINHFRSMSFGPITSNSVYRLFKAPMTLRAKIEDSRYAKWTTGIHGSQFHDAANFDPTSVSVTGFRTAADGKIPTSAAPIPIKDMANGVKVFPIGNDALDLTRAVKYCQEHPDEQCMYPSDFERLVKERLGGPAKVKPAHHDGAAIARYTSNRIAVGVSLAKGRKRDSRGRLQKVDSDEEEEDISMTDSSDDEVDFESSDKKRRKRKALFDDPDSDELDTPFCKRKSKRAKTSPKSRTTRKTSFRNPAPSRLRKSFLGDDIDSDSDGDAYRGPKKSKKAPASVRRSKRKIQVTQTYDVETFDAFDDEEEDTSQAVRDYQDSESEDEVFEDEV